MKIVIIGAGPAGLLLAHYLLAQSPTYHISIYDKRPDPRSQSDKHRAFVISLTERGQQTLAAIDGLWPAVRRRGIEVRKTGVYSKKQGKWQVFQRSSASEQFSLLINRNELCTVMLEELAQRWPTNVNIVFDATCLTVDLKTHQVRLASPDREIVEQPYDLLVGADGVHSVVRTALMRQPGFDFQQSYFPSVWKVLHIPRPKDLDPDTSYFFRHNFPARQLGQAPNQLSGAVIPELNNQCCLLMFWGQSPQKPIGNPPGVETVEDLQTQLCETWLPGIHLSDAAATELFNQRPSSIVETRCNRYHDTAGQVVLMGDAAHSMSSFLAQGCQAAFGDAVALAQLLHTQANNLELALPQYSAQQVPEGQAITDLNTHLKPRSPWLSLIFNMAMGVRGQLSQRFPTLIHPPFFTLLSKTTVPYTEIAHWHRGWMAVIHWFNQRRA